MACYLKEVKEKTEHIVKTLLGDLPSIRISILAHGDYCDHEKYVVRRMDLSNEGEALAKFIKECGPTTGGDGDECYELVLREALNLSWTPTSAKALVVIGDAAPHKKHEYRGIDWEEELEKLNAMGVRVYGVRCGSRQDFYEKIAEKTEGATLELKDLQGITEMVMGLCYREAAAEYGRRRDAMEAVGGEEGGASSSGKPEEGKEVMMGPEPAELERPEDVIFDQEAAKTIHNAIHEGKREVKVRGKIYEISLGRAGCKFVKIGDETYIEQNKDKSSRYAQMAIEGRKITWIIRKGKWGLIMDQGRNVELADPNEDGA